MSTARVEETVWIPLSDGCRLAARIWSPEDASLPAPAVLELLPYRRRDRHRGDDAILHPALADRGLVAVRVDLRGSGDSDGVLLDEYTAQEGADALEVIAWLAAQPWCDGAVGMIGLSWSGFNALRVAALRPPALKAIVTACASDDRYADDMHYRGGCLLGDNLQYGATLLTWMATPPDPAIVGDRWRALWLERLAAVEPPAARWLAHPTRDAYWTAGEPGPELDAAVLAVGGWADGYTNTVMRLLSRLRGPCRGVIGPWAHAFPHVATPGPGIDFVGLVVRWFDHWLRGRDTGVMDEPALVAWLQESEQPRGRFAERRGRWVAERTWPSPAVAPRRLHLSGAGLGAVPGAVERAVASPADTGLQSGEWCPYGAGNELPLDQAADDARSLTFDSEPLAEPLQLLGGTDACLQLSADVPDGQVAVRLVDLRPDGSCARITYGLLNLLHRDGHDRAVPPVPGVPFTVRIRLDDVGYEVPAGHRLRLALSTAYWPVAVPVPVPVRLTVHAGWIDLPVRTPPAAEVVPPLGKAWSPPALATEVIAPLERGRVEVGRPGPDGGPTRVEVVRTLGVRRLHDVDLELTALGSETYAVEPSDPSTARAEARRTAALARGDWRPRIDTTSVLRFEDGAWHHEAELVARDGDELVFRRRWLSRHARLGD